MILYYIIVPLAWLVFNIGFRVRCEGRENLKKVGTKGCIIAPNHISAIDPVFIVITRFWGQRMMVFAKKELFEINPFLSWFFRCAGAVCVRGTKEEVGAIDDTVKKCKEGGTLLIFPEGTRVKNPGQAEVKGGAAMMAIRSGVDMIPMFIDTKKRLFRRVRIIIGRPYSPVYTGRKGTAEEYQANADEIMRRAYALGGITCR